MVLVVDVLSRASRGGRPMVGVVFVKSRARPRVLPAHIEMRVTSGGVWQIHMQPPRTCADHGVAYVSVRDMAQWMMHMDAHVDVWVHGVRCGVERVELSMVNWFVYIRIYGDGGD